VLKKLFCSGKACFSGSWGNLNSFEFQPVRWPHKTDEQVRPLQFWGFSKVLAGHSALPMKFLLFEQGFNLYPDLAQALGAALFT
jgi:hypothetical protein